MDTGLFPVTSARDPVGIAIRMIYCLSIEAPKFTRYVFGATSWNNLVSILFSFQTDVAICSFPLSNCSLTAREGIPCDRIAFKIKTQ